MSGNQLLCNGSPFALHGVDRSGSEYACEQGWGIFDGPNATSDASVIAVIASWKANAVFYGLNEDCWLGINGVKQAYSRQNYINAIKQAVSVAEQNGMSVIIGWFWGAPGTTLATSGPHWLAPDNDHAPLFWEKVANAFKNDPNVTFRLMEEPGTGNISNAGWQCWSQGDVSYSTTSDNAPPTPPTPTGTPDFCTNHGVGPGFPLVGMRLSEIS